MKFPQIGEILPNGHTVLAAYAVGEDRYVLAHREGAPQPYAVWSVDQDGDTRNGSYFEKFPTAQTYFADMISDHLERESQQLIRKSQENYKYEQCIKGTMCDVYTAIFKYFKDNSARKKLVQFLHETGTESLPLDEQVAKAGQERRDKQALDYYDKLGREVLKKIDNL